MAEIADAINSWLRDYVTDGVPASGINAPSKAEGRSIGAIIEAYVADKVTEISGEGGAIDLRCDVTTDTGSVTSGTAKYTFRLPHGVLLTEVRASLTAASSSGAVIVDINADGVSMLSTKLHVDQGDLTSVGSATPFAFSTTDFADDTEITIDVDSAGASATGLKVTLIGVRTSFGAPTTPYFFGAGTVATANIGTGNVSMVVDFPAAIASGDIAFLSVAQIFAGSTSSLDWVTPSGWTKVGTNVSVTSTYTLVAALYWRRCDGTETTVTVSENDAESSVYAMGKVSVFRGCVALGDPFAALGQDNDTGLTMNGSTIVSLVNSSLAVTFYAARAYASAPADVGWTSIYSETALGAGARLLCASTHPAALAGTIAAENRVLSTSTFGDTWATWAMALIPGT